MDDIDQDVKPIAGEEASNDTSSVPEPKATGEAGTEPAEPTSTEDGDIGETGAKTEDAPKKGAQARIRELNAKARSAEEKAQSLEHRLAELTGRVDQQPPQGAYTPQIEPGTEYSPDQFKQEVMKTADAMVTLRVKQSEAINRINTEAAQVISKYPQLDPDSDQFDKELSDSVTEATLAHVQASPFTASPRTFVERMMKPYQRAVTKEVGKVTENLAKQVSETATRPTAVSTKGGKSDREKTVAELESELGFVN